MRTRLIVFLALAGGAAVLSLLRGQEASQTPTGRSPAASPRDIAAAAAAGLKPVRDFSKLDDVSRQLLFCSQSGADWLFRMNTAKGRFLPGWRPALAAPMDDDDFYRQATATFALARAARVFGEERYAARAAQAVLVLLEETALDPQDPKIRCPNVSTAGGARLGAAGLLVLAINELPDPQADLLEKSEQLCNFIRRQARPEGSLADGDDRTDAAGLATVGLSAGPALYGLARSQRLRPAPWKTDLVRKALADCRSRWKDHKDYAAVPWLTAACAETYPLAKEQALADFGFEMNDWLCGLQYGIQTDARRTGWAGGFKGWADGKAVDSPPGVVSADGVAGLADACRLAREVGDPDRHKRYTEAVRGAGQFLRLLQYTEGNTAHFHPDYKPSVLGGFHPSASDGDLPIEHTARAAAALMEYLEHAAR
jgi:hypothetical protein